MKRFILFLIVPLLYGCEKYEVMSAPSLSGGKWILSNYEIIPISSISTVTIIKNDTMKTIIMLLAKIFKQRR